MIPALRAELIKIRATRSPAGALAAVLLATAGITAAVCAALGTAEADNPDFDPVLFSYYGLNFGQIAAITFGTLAVTSEYSGGGIRLSLTAVPRRGRFFAAKTAAIGGLALAVGLVTGPVTFLTGQALLREHGIGLTDPGGLRSALGSGVYLALMALFAAGLAMVLRSGVAVLSILVPLVLIVSFVIGDVAGGVAPYLPDRAGQLVVHQHPEGPLGPWQGLAVTAAWAAAALLAGWHCLRRRDA
ncbi:ABC transporter permease subunit [Streptomyces sp. GC420]|uniref:ABC transporter permease subunit n=1 Tax=Streptomyces sp. GC420 TaxID=2697568 RepID=UPI001414F053|nr:ABC transporter permease subunit [Streptomyces sp. GC420]NBM14959.1 ABC transporter permease subunit [Streptomyces sp. GC420]